MDASTENVHIKLTWTDSAGETSYLIYRTQDETQLADFPAAWSLVDTVGTGTTVFHDYSVEPYNIVLNPKATYYYTVVARNVDGDTESNIDSATMPALDSGSGGSGGGGCFIDASGGSAGSSLGGGAILLLALLLSGLFRGRRIFRSCLTGH
ncbi:MAG: hypothetical protein A2Z34_06495 [Planctomycetes bacterium RBG_16_59_8]|nr:MAG: hypothetical protein A2Z34_06495 [Planctomycetes bacterium RBG_16_59_8]